MHENTCHLWLQLLACYPHLCRFSSRLVSIDCESTKKMAKMRQQNPWASWARSRVMQVFHCWWFRNPAHHPLLACIKPVVNHGIHTGFVPSVFPVICSGNQGWRLFWCLGVKFVTRPPATNRTGLGSLRWWRCKGVWCLVLGNVSLWTCRTGKTLNLTWNIFEILDFDFFWDISHSSKLT